MPTEKITLPQLESFLFKSADILRGKMDTSEFKELLRSDSSDLVMAMIHKFRETGLTEMFPELNACPHILVMTDEAHHSQYAMFGANLDKGVTGDMGILIVMNMLITGFDAPVDQVMYPDKAKAWLKENGQLLEETI